MTSLYEVTYFNKWEFLFQFHRINGKNRSLLSFWGVVFVISEIVSALRTKVMRQVNFNRRASFISCQNWRPLLLLKLVAIYMGQKNQKNYSFQQGI